MKKAIGMFAALILALGMSGIAYAHWSETLIISGTVSTGNVDVAWSDVGSWDTDDWVLIDGELTDIKDVSSIVCKIDVDDPNLLHVTVTNAYPCIDYYNVVDIHCVGSIPVHLYGVSIPSTDPAVLVEISYYEDPAAKIPIESLPVQLHYCEQIYALIHVHLVQDEALEGQTYTFTAEIVADQWNYTPGTPS
ncbi:hypothetical protein ES703_00792 [subsurface metagenome]